ncbi:hypothetical protein BDD12DRAFT_487990 [Trichophaea hybrida]|nr:hypothetical protein BDD12DRAFT_487990 [Trichophaea hybrida]
MSTVSRICLRCRIRILSNGPALPSAFLLQSRGAGQRSLHSRSHPPQSRLYSTKSTKITDTPDDSAAPTYRANRPSTDFDPMADPVLVKLTGIVEPLIDKPPKRTSGGITTVDVEEFLAKAKKTKQQNEEVLPTGIDAHMIDEKYGELLEASTNRRKRVGVAPSKPSPPLADLEAKFNYPPATHLVEQIDSHLGDKTVVIHGLSKKCERSIRRFRFWISTIIAVARMSEFRSFPALQQTLPKSRKPCTTPFINSRRLSRFV